MVIQIKQLVNIITDIKNDKEWVNDSHSHSAYHGGVDAMNRILKHLAETRDANAKEQLRKIVLGSDYMDEEDVKYWESKAELHYEQL